MHDTTFSPCDGHLARLRNRRSFLGGVIAALPALGGFPLAVEGKKNHKHNNRHKTRKGIRCNKEKDCRQAVLAGCDLAPEIPNCKNRVKNCCSKACKSEDDAVECLADIGF